MNETEATRNQSYYPLLERLKEEIKDKAKEFETAWKNELWKTEKGT